jgi:3-oxoacyl-[acyl-carrier-protein] synthase-3
MNAMTTPLQDLTAHLLHRVRLMQENLGGSPEAACDPAARFADLFDSMGMVEFLNILAQDCGASPDAIEQTVDRRFGTVAELAGRLLAAGLIPRAAGDVGATSVAEVRSTASPRTACWLAATAARLPDAVEPAAVLNAALHRAPGWLETHAGIHQRRVWADQDPLDASAAAGREALARGGLVVEEVGALLVTSEAPPLLAGLAAVLHQRLDLRPETAAVEVGGACTGFLAAAWLAQGLLDRLGAVLVIALESPSRYLRVEPGPAGEAAALFGDGAAAALLCARRPGAGAVSLGAVALGSDGSAAHLLRVEHAASGAIAVHMEGRALALRAVRVMAQSVRDLAARHGLTVTALGGVVAHGGNGRMPALLARQLGLPLERVWSETAGAGNLGAASLPAAWAAHQPPPAGTIAWVAVGAGLTWAAALTGPAGE